MLIDEVEAIWDPIAENDDWSLFENTLAEIGDLRRAYGSP
jgi:Zn-dependent M32 family carboxypeptidase